MFYTELLLRYEMLYVGRIETIKQVGIYSVTPEDVRVSSEI